MSTDTEQMTKAALDVALAGQADRVVEACTRLAAQAREAQNTPSVSVEQRLHDLVKLERVLVGVHEAFTWRTL